MNRMQSKGALILCFLLMGAFVVNAATEVEGENLLAVSVKNAVETPKIWPEITKETTVKIANQSSTDLILYVNNVDMILPQETMVWIPCDVVGGQIYSELTSAGDNGEAFFIVSECGDSLTIQGKE